MERIEMIISYSTDGTDFFYCDNHGLLTRCKDCKHFSPDFSKKAGMCYRNSNVVAGGNLMVSRVDADFYCAGAERNE